MDAKQELDAMLKNPQCHAILVNALEDYLGRLKEISETGVSSDEAAYFERSIHLAESLSDVFYRWP